MLANIFVLIGRGNCNFSLSLQFADRGVVVAHEQNILTLIWCFDKTSWDSAAEYVVVALQQNFSNVDSVSSGRTSWDSVVNFHGTLMIDDWYDVKLSSS